MLLVMLCYENGALDGLPLKGEEKDYLLELIRKFSKVFFVDILGFCIYPVK